MIHPRPTFKPDKSKQKVALIILRLVKWGGMGKKIQNNTTTDTAEYVINNL